MKYKIKARRFQIYDKAGMHYIFTDIAYLPTAATTEQQQQVYYQIEKLLLIYIIYWYKIKVTSA